MKYGGPVYIAIGFGLILMVAYAYLYIVFPSLNPDLFSRALHFGLGAVLFCNILFNYCMCIFTKPGTTALLKEVCFTCRIRCSILHVCNRQCATVQACDTV